MSHVFRHVIGNRFIRNFCFFIKHYSNDRHFDINDDLIDYKQFAEFSKVLKEKNITFQNGYTCVKFECRLCILRNERHPAYINKKTGIFLCPKCDVKKKLSDFIRLYEHGHQLQVKTSEWKPLNTANRNVDNVKQSVCDSLKIKGLSVDDLNNIGVLYDSKLNLLYFPLKNAIGSTVGEKIYDITKQTENTIQSTICSGLLIYGAKTKRKAIVVTNILDFLVIVAQHLENYAVVCLPYFLKTLPQECLPALEIFIELIFWFDCDSSSWDAARTFSQKLNEGRCLLIRPTDSEPSPHKAYKRKLNLHHILVMALPVLHKSITTFGAIKHDVLSELQNKEKVNGVKWKRFPVLNKLLKGHRRGELTIITGPTGSGKTTFMSEYSLDLALQGVSTLWGSFEIRNSRLAATLLRQFVGYSLEKKVNEFDYWATELEKYPLYFMTFHGQQPINIVMDAIKHAQYVLDVSHVIIDNLQFMMGVSSNYKRDKFWEQDAIIASFRSFATKYNVHVTLVMHPRKERDEDDLTTSSVFGSAKATQEADNVLIIQDKRLVSVKGKKYLQIAKNRYSGDLGVMTLEFDKEALSYSTTKKKEKPTVQ